MELNRDSSMNPELRLILVGNIGCGKTLTADTLLCESSPTGVVQPSRQCDVRCGVSEGRQLRVVETPRWYWKGQHVDAGVQRETERALSLTAPGPHAFLILVPVGEFTEVEGRIPSEMERMFGKGAMEHSLVLLTCGDYLMGRDEERYLRLDEPELGAMVNRCGGRWHVINNRKPQDRTQVASLLDKVERLVQSSGGCYLPNAVQSEFRGKDEDLHRRFSLRAEERLQSDHSSPTQSTWTDGFGRDEFGKRGVTRVRSLVEPDRVMSQDLRNGLYSEPNEAPAVERKSSSFKLSKEGAILSQMSKLSDAKDNPNYTNSIHYRISSTSDSGSPPPSPTAAFVSNSFSKPYSFSSSSLPSSSTFKISTTYSPSSSTTPSFSSTLSSSTDPYSTSNTASKAYSSSSSSFVAPSLSTTTYSSSKPEAPPSVSNSSSATYSSTSPVSPSFSPKSSSLPSVSTSKTFSSSSSSSVAPLLSSSTVTSALSSIFSAGSSNPSALTLVLLGRAGSGKSAAGNTILGHDEFKLRQPNATGATTQSCQRGSGTVKNKQVVVVDTPDWFWSGCSPDDLKAHLSSCMSLSAPGPHMFLLCIPVTLPARSTQHDLTTIEEAFGPEAIRRRTLVLFTHSDLVKDDVEQYISAKRPEMLGLVEKCGDRYHVLRRGGDRDSVAQLLDKVEQAVKESGGGHYSRQEEVGRERVTQSRRVRGEDEVDRALSTTLHSLREEEEIEPDEKSPKTQEPAPTSSFGSKVGSVLGSALLFVGQKVGEGAKRVPKLVAGGALLGGVLGIFVGGPIGGAVGATAGTVAAEYGRRKYNKPKTE